MMKIVALALLAVSVNAQTDVGVSGDDKQVQFRIPGATLTVKDTSGNCGAPQDPTTILEQGTTAAFIQNRIDTALSDYATKEALQASAAELISSDEANETFTDVWNDVSEAMKDSRIGMQTDMKTAVDGMKKQLESMSVSMYVTSFKLVGSKPGDCVANMTESTYTCSGGEANITVTFYGQNLIRNAAEGLYFVCGWLDDMEYCANATTNSQGNYESITGVLPNVHKSGTFNMTLYAKESTTRIASTMLKPVTYINVGPEILSGTKASAYMIGDGNSLAGNKLTIPFVIFDKRDTKADIEATFTPADTNVIANGNSFTWNKNADTLDINLVGNWVNALKTRGSTNSSAEETFMFEVELTDSEDDSSFYNISVTLSVNILKWGPEGSSDRLSAKARKAIKDRTGSSAKWEMCFSLARDGWDNDKYTQNCLNKGPTVLLMRTKTSDRFFGGFMHVDNPFTNNQCAGYIDRGVYGTPSTSVVTDRGWLFRVFDNSPDTVEFASQRNRYAYYSCPNYDYFHVFGGGHDWYCGRTNCYCRFGFSYNSDSSTVSYPSYDWCTGTRYEYPLTTFDFYEVYVTQP